MTKTTITNTPSKLMNRYKKNETIRIIQTTTTTQENEIKEQQNQQNQQQHLHWEDLNNESNENSFLDYQSHHHNDNNSTTPNNNNNNNNNNRITELENEIQQLQTERDDLIREKKFWLTKIQSDNTKLVTLLQVRTSYLLLQLYQVSFFSYILIFFFLSFLLSFIFFFLPIISFSVRKINKR